MTLFNFGAIRCALGNAIYISPEVIEFGTVGTGLVIEHHQSKETIILRPPKKTRLPRKAHIGGKA